MRNISLCVCFFLLLALGFSKCTVIAEEKTTAAEEQSTVEENRMTEEKSFRIVIDPGHGGQAPGADHEASGTLEKTINLKIGLYLKKELEKYKNVEVFMTRDSDEDVELDDRTAFSVDKEADLMVSLHNNASGPMCMYDNGCTVLASEGLFRPEIAQEEQELSVCILHELHELGLENQGILLRESQEGETYSNGEIADYYRLVRGGVNVEIPTVIVEHAFLDHDGDYEKFLSDDDKLKALAKADARGIARYYQLARKKDDSVLSKLSNIKERIVLIVDEDYRHNKVSESMFFSTESDGKDKNSKGNNGNDAGTKGKDEKDSGTKDTFSSMIREYRELIVERMSRCLEIIMQCTNQNSAPRTKQ